MPLPRPLRKGASKQAQRKRVGEVMHDLKHGPHHSQRTRAQEIRIALDNARGTSRKKKRSGKKIARRVTRR